ncbi:septation protein SepH [Bifidobacterium cuniculi]|uniref:DNA binding protein n=1 Tax=Bifidobacterium cuniculi TaxID=1688 RepID=A0A087B3R3_9BIFI|nr:septation protein SepH [Bifidobacterium cuniculi]KFI65663.1 DNA binding protein [Bifidobacterium cuniculi]
MASENYPTARFDSVTDTGALVFAAGDQRFVVPVDDRLEHALLEAKQVLAERREVNVTPPTRTLPISQIQSLIRAGLDPDQVAQRYGLSPALVRRFSATVQSEKAYAIEQFLHVPAPKESNMRTLEDLIDRTLAAARIRSEEVSWGATRRGLEPWRITASFTSAGRPIRAEWSWNMRDNSVVCINKAARKLIGELDASPLPPATQDDADDEVLPRSIDLPGNSVRSARIEMTVSALGGGQPDPGTDEATPEGDKDDMRQDAPIDHVALQPARDLEPEAKDTPAAEKTDVPASATSSERPHGSRGHRPPVPSWDEIMFGTSSK